jgi:hypothetical protein
MQWVLMRRNCSNPTNLLYFPFWDINKVPTEPTDSQPHYRPLLRRYGYPPGPSILAPRGEVDEWVKSNAEKDRVVFQQGDILVTREEGSRLLWGNDLPEKVNYLQICP